MPRKKKRSKAKRPVGSPSKPGHPARSSKASSPGNSSRTWWRIATVIMAIGLLIRLAYLIDIHDDPDFKLPWIDAAYHDMWARGIAFDNWQVPEGMTDPEIRSRPYFRPPGYPYFLGAVYKISGGSYWAPRLVQFLLGVIGILLVMLLARAALDPNSALIAGGLMACSWAAIHFEAQLMAPSLLVVLGCGLLLALSRWQRRITLRSGLIAGILFGLFALVRPNILLFGPVIIAWGFWVARKHKDWASAIRGIFCLILSAALVIAPATIRNARVSGEPVLITCNAGINLHIGNNPKTDGMSAVFPELTQLTGLKGWTSFDYPKIVAGVSKQEGRQLTDTQVSSYFTHKALSYARQHPGRVFQLMAKKAALFWGPTEISNNKELSLEKKTSWVLRFLPGFAWILSFALLGLLLFLVPQSRDVSRHNPDKATLTTLIIAFVVTYFLSYLPFFVVGRFRVPILPYLMVFAGFACSSMWIWIRQKKTNRFVQWLPVLVGLMIATNLSVVPEQGDSAVWHYHKGIAHQTQGKTQAAIAEFRRAIEVRQDFADAWEKLGNGLYQAGDVPAAVDAWTQVLNSRSDAEVLNNLAWVRATSADPNLRDPIKAVEQARQACDITRHRDPGKLDTLAVALAASGAFDEACALTRRAIDLAESQNKSDLVEELRENLSRFESGQPITLGDDTNRRPSSDDRD